MGETAPRETGKIVDLAAFRRARAVGRARETGPAPRPPNIGGGAWYHEAAIRDDDRDRRT